MRKKQILLACLAALVLTGCGGKKEEIYRQAGESLESGDYKSALQGYEASIAEEVHLGQSYRGAGIAQLELGNYGAAAEYFDSALAQKNLSDKIRRDILQYKVTAYYKDGQYEAAMAGCQDLSEYEMDEQSYFLTGKTALALDSYDEASRSFQYAYGADPTYETAIEIYQAYLEKEMEADGTQYLENSLNNQPSSAQDYYDRGRVYYLMEDYGNAQKELIEAMNKGSKEAVLLMAKAYLAQNDISNARAMYQQYIAENEESAKGYIGLALCDIKDGQYESALSNLSQGLQFAGEEDMQDLLYNQMVVYEKLQDYSSAYSKVQEYLEKYPGDQEAEKERIYLSTRLQEASGASSSPQNEEGSGDSNEGSYEDPYTDDSYGEQVYTEDSYGEYDDTEDGMTEAGGWEDYGY